VADQILEVEDTIGAFPAYPRILDPLYGIGDGEASWIACGTAALGFDPICGEGVGHAIREAILVAAVIDAIANHFPVTEVLEHYSSRLLAGFFRHLTACQDFYSAARQSDWWDEELQLIKNGMQWTRDQMTKRKPPSYRLAGFDLERCLTV
jgi:2-polyprenyl-6-methoxyphenol hydroxylase-like FAD-dependent oxidoreductase